MKAICLFVAVFIVLTPTTKGVFSPSFVWSAINKSLEEDRLSIVDANNEKVKVKGCVRLVLFNSGSENYKEGNHSGHGVLWIDVTEDNFANENVTKEVRERIKKINEGICVPCVVVISLVNVTSNQQEREYQKMGGIMEETAIKIKVDTFQDYKKKLSQQLLLLLQFKTPIQARHLIFVRLVDNPEELTKCHGKKYTRYPRRLVSIWEQVLFDHFKEARVIQGALKDEGGREGQNKILISGKETGVWVWMCEEIIRRLEIQENCEKMEGGEEKKEKCFRENQNLTTGGVDMTDDTQCRMYRARS